MNPNALLSEQCDIVVGFAPGTPSSTTPDYVCLKGYERCAILIVADNATTVTGSAITVKQATDVAGTGEKALAFTTARRNIDVATADGLADFTVASNTFTTDATNNSNLLYEINIKGDELDVNNGFDCIRAGTGNATASVLAVLYFLYPKKQSAINSAIVD